MFMYTDYNQHLLDNVKKIHFIGCGGSGMYPLIQILAAKGYEISGSDVLDGSIIRYEREMGVKVSLGHSADNIIGVDMVVYSAAISKDNVELCAASSYGIPTIERSVLLGYVANTYPCPICISGTHGKTTTTAMTVQIMVMAGLDPAVVIGGKLPLIDGYGRYGAGRNIVVEACEYHNTFLQLVPHTSVVLNIDADHLEFFKTMDNLKAAFRKFALLTEHRVIANIDDANTLAAVDEIDRDVRTFGVHQQADYRAVNVREYRPSFFEFDVAVHGVPGVHVRLSVPGYHNVYNALAAYACAEGAGCTPGQCAQGLTAFRGAGRRFEILGEVNGVTIADDYAHHPTEIAALLDAARRRYPDSTVRVIFQPHLFSRTKFFAHQFAKSLAKADDVIITGIFPAREKQADFPDISPSTIVDAAAGLKDASAGTWIQPVEDMCLAAKMMAMRAHHGDVIFTVGAGDITDMDQVLLTALEAHRESCE